MDRTRLLGTELGEAEFGSERGRAARALREDGRREAAQRAAGAQRARVERLSGLLRAYGPHLLLLGGFVKAIGVAALAPLVGAPLWLALTAAALWVVGPAVAALLWKRWDARRAATAAS